MAYFGTDGIRGKDCFFTKEFLGKVAAATVLKYGAKRIIIARDPRTSGQWIERNLTAALASYGAEVVSAGMLPTPVLAYLARAYGAAVGIMISASHNPPEYNGIKFFDGTGAKIAIADEAEIEELIDSGRTPPAGAGKVSVIEGEQEYIAHFKSAIKPKLEGLRVLLDTANGAMSFIAPELYRSLGCTVDTIYDETDGKNINVNCGATNIDVLLSAMNAGDYDIGFSFDGDGDRVMAVKKGKILDGDNIMYILARYLGESEIVGTVMTNMGTEKALASHGIKLARAAVGDKYVAEKIEELGVSLGGEKSGHIIIKYFQNTGDGLLTSLLLAVADAEKGCEFYDDMVQCPYAEKTVKADEKEKEFFGADPVSSEFASRLENEKGARIVARPSGTEPKIRIMAEAESYERAREAAEKLAEFVEERIKEFTLGKGAQKGNLGIPNGGNMLTGEALEKAFSASGATIISPESTFIEEGVKLAAGAVIYPFVWLSGTTEIGAGAKIYSFCDLTDTQVGEYADLRSSYALGAKIGARTTVGPFACLRKGAVIGEDCRVGDFVEVKNSELAEGVKCAHLAYIGDATVGAHTNVGCGTVFANYNGAVKQRTKVGSEVFIGANSNLVAPLTIGDGAYIAAGSTVTENVPENTLCIARTRQEIKESWKKPVKNK